jgi:Fe-S cluster biogenesis protein NfuA
MSFDEKNILDKSTAIEEAVKTKVLPMLAFDGGSCEVIDIKPTNSDTVEVYIRYLGACSSCSSSGGATLFAIEEILRKELGTTQIRVLAI